MSSFEHTPSLETLLSEIGNCRACAEGNRPLPHEPKPVLRASASARILIAGQAPGTRVHESGVPFTDPSGDRLRDWLGMTEVEFYDTERVAIVPMGFCFPGLTEKGADLPPRKECPSRWRARVLQQMPSIELTLLVGGYAQKWHLGKDNRSSLTETVLNWRAYAPAIFPTPHPSWRNNFWLKKNPWFEAELLPVLRRRVRDALAQA